jgi:hypothetical protein
VEVLDVQVASPKVEMVVLRWFAEQELIAV